jgi:D-serine deaminase-like pyridoxal phosphate-dependent protein
VTASLTWPTVDAMASAPPTPYLCVDAEVLRRNVRRVADWAAAHRVALRPHAKTHKCLQVADLQLSAGAVGLSVATIGEAEVFARHGVRDLVIAYPLWVDDAGAARLRELAGRTRLAVAVESEAGAANLGRHVGGSGIEVLVEVDSGHHRTGCHPERAGELARVATRTGLVVRGAMTFPGHSYSPATTTSAASEEAEALRVAAASLRAVGVEPRVLSGGSTPSLAATDLGEVTEVRPGVYVFGDAQQCELGTCSPDDVALTCRSTVVSASSDAARGHRMVLDAGSKALGADRAAWSSGHGRVVGRPDARIVMLSEHHAVVELDGPPPTPGTLVDVVPNHVCSAVNLADDLWVVDRSRLERWPVAARGRNA